MDLRLQNSRIENCIKHNQSVVLINQMVGPCCYACLQQLPGNTPIEQYNQQVQDGPKNCAKHNQPIILINQDLRIDFCCVVCLQLLPGNISIEQLNEHQKLTYEQVYSEIDFDHQFFQQLLEELVNYRQNINLSLEKLIRLVLDQIKLIKDFKTNIIQTDKNKQSLNNDILQISNKQQQTIKDVKVQIVDLVKSYQSKHKEIEEIFPILEKHDQAKQTKKSLQINKIKISEVSIQQEQQINKFEYELIKESTLKEQNYCFAFAFNKINTILLVACYKEIIVHKFHEGRISQKLQSLNNHSGDIICLYFMNKSNSFVSGSKDKSIIIWMLDQNNQYIVQQVLKEHSDSINCLTVNKRENMLFSGSGDCTLKFWIKTAEGWNCKQNIKTSFNVRNMSLNQREDTLLICENNCDFEIAKSCIQILKQQNDEQWIIMQTLSFSEWGWRLCFTIGDQFLFSTQNSNFLQIYDYVASQQEFQKIQQLQVQNIDDCIFGFPCQNIQSLNIVAFKHGRFLNLIKVNENYNYELMQSIEFDHYIIFGGMTKDGQYLVTWNQQSKEIQIRQLKK